MDRASKKKRRNRRKSTSTGGDGVVISPVSVPIGSQNHSHEFHKAKKSIVYFQKYLMEFILKLSQAFPERIDETNMESIMATLKPIKEDNVEKYRNLQDLKRSPVFKYMARYLNHILNSREHIRARKLDLFEKEKRAEYKISKKPLIDLDIDFTELWQSQHITDQLKTTILTYLGLMVTISSEAVGLFDVSSKNKTAIAKQKAVRQYKRKEMKNKIYDLLGEGGKNSSINVVIDDILEEFEKSKRHLQAGQADPQKLTGMIKNLYGKLTDKYEEGQLDEKELVFSSKTLFSNVMNNDDINLRESLGNVMNLMKTEDNDENILKEMMNQAGMPDGMDFESIAEKMQSGENPFDGLMEQMAKEEKDTKDPKTEESKTEDTKTEE